MSALAADRHDARSVSVPLTGPPQAVPVYGIVSRLSLLLSTPVPESVKLHAGDPLTSAVPDAVTATVVALVRVPVADAEIATPPAHAAENVPETAVAV